MRRKKEGQPIIFSKEFGSGIFNDVIPDGIVPQAGFNRTNRINDYLNMDFNGEQLRHWRSGAEPTQDASRKRVLAERREASHQD